jgi:hypothetical protein
LTKIKINIALLSSISVSKLLSHSSIATQKLATFSPQLSAQIYHLAQLSYIHAFQYSMLVTSFFALIAVILAIVKIKK